MRRYIVGTLEYVLAIIPLMIVLTVSLAGTAEARDTRLLFFSVKFLLPKFFC